MLIRALEQLYVSPAPRRKGVFFHPFFPKLPRTSLSLSLSLSRGGSLCVVLRETGEKLFKKKSLSRDHSLSFEKWSPIFYVCLGEFCHSLDHTRVVIETKRKFGVRQLTPSLDGSQALGALNDRGELTKWGGPSLFQIEDSLVGVYIFFH